jgi:hypothetical protein
VLLSTENLRTTLSTLAALMLASASAAQAAPVPTPPPSAKQAPSNEAKPGVPAELSTRMSAPVPIPANEKPGHTALPGHLNTQQATVLYSTNGLQSLLMRRFFSIESLKTQSSSFSSIPVDEITWNGSKRTVFREVIQAVVAKKAMGQFSQELQDYLKKSPTVAQSDLGVAKAVKDAFN